jgi:hypothetical protein
MRAASWRGATLAVVAALALSALLASCADAPTTPVGKVSPEITSGTVSGGQRALFFLTRAKDRRKFAGKFDATLSPQVLVCSEPRCVSPVLGPIGLGSVGPARLNLDRARQSYVFRWKTRGGALLPNAVYRLVVRVGDYQLGWVDLATGTKQRDLRAINRREFVPLRLGSTLTLPFRIEKGAAFPPDLPGRYETEPDACSPAGCLLHSDPDFDYFGVWAAVQITQTGTMKTGMISYTNDRIDPPVVPPIPAPGTGPLNGAGDLFEPFATVTWTFGENSCLHNGVSLDLWTDGLAWGHWCGTPGGPAGIISDFDPLVRFTGLNRLPNYLPPIQ